MKNPKKKKKAGAGNCYLTLEFDPAVFSRELLAEINLFRSNPKQYAEKLRSHIAYIKEEKEKLIYQNGDVKTVLNQGAPAFNKAIDILTNTSPLGNLDLNDEKKIEVPEDPETQTTSFKNLQPALKVKFPGKKFGFTFDLGAPIAETIVVLQLVDDNKSNGNRRNCFLDTAFSQLGVSIKKGKAKHYAIYLTFSD